MNPARISARCLVCLVTLLAGFASLPLRHAMATEAGRRDVCRKWPENRLALDASLRSRRFELSASGELKKVPPPLEPDAREVYYRIFVLSLDAAEPIALFRTNTKKTCVIARDSEKAQPIKVPVFFVGAGGRPAPELEDDAKKADFDASSPLSDDEEFVDVRFHLKRAGYTFSSIRPFFVCGLPGVMLCEGSCPGDLLPRAQLLVEWALNRPPEPEDTSGHEVRAGGRIADSSAGASPAQQQTRARETASHGPVAAAPTLNTAAPGQPSCPPAASPAPGATPVPAPQVAERQGSAWPAPEKKQETEAKKQEIETKKQEAEAKKQETEEKKQETEEKKAQTEGGGAGPGPSRKLVLAFERKSGAAIAAEEIVQMEGNIAVLGAPAVPEAGGLAVELPEGAFEEAKKLETLKNVFRHYEVLAVEPEEARVIVALEPRFIRASDLTIKIAGGGNENVSGCDLALDVFPDWQLGPGWATAKVQRLRFHEVGPFYALELPENTGKNDFLIDTAKEGTAAQLLSVATGCRLEARPGVSAEEIRSGSIVRALPEAAGQILIALVSTDSDFSDQVGVEPAKGFWAGALGLVSSVSEGAWEKRLLGRAQSLAFSQETKILEGLRSSRLAAQGERDALIEKLVEGSRPGSGVLPGAGSKPLPQFELDPALGMIMGDAGLEPRDGAPRQGLLLITGGVDPAAGHFCRNPVPDTSSGGGPQWMRQARKVFVLEVWSEAFARSLEQVSRAKPAEGAPPGVYACNVSGADGGNIALYGVLASSLTGTARAGAFAYLTARANSHLRP